MCADWTDTSLYEMNVIHTLEQTRDQFLAVIDGLTVEQWHSPPAPGRWSIAEIVEHLALLEMVFHKRIVPALVTGPAPTRPASVGDELVRLRAPDRSTRLDAPGPVTPTGRWNEIECVRRFGELRAQTIEFARHPTVEFRDHTFDHPYFGPLDTHQWLILIALHAARHTAQILEVRAGLIVVENEC